MRSVGENPFRLDSPRPTIPLKDYAYSELRYSALASSRPTDAAELLRQAQVDVQKRYKIYEEFAKLNEGPTAAQTAPFDSIDNVTGI